MWEGLGGNFWVFRIATRTGIKNESSARRLRGRVLNCHWSEKGQLKRGCRDVQTSGDIVAWRMLFKNPQLSLNFPNKEHTVADVARALGHKAYLCSNVYLSVRPTLGT